MPKRTDANQKAIVRALRDAGASVLILSSVGHGCPDICIGIAGVNLLAEIKNMNGKGRIFTDDEKCFMDGWKGTINVICDEQEALDLLDRFQRAVASKPTVDWDHYEPPF